MVKHLAVAVAMCVAVPFSALACDGQEHAAKQMSVKDTAALATAKKATMVDANDSKTRTKYGVAPGAILLTSSSKYDPSKELPADKSGKLVFYCANTMCTASHHAAERAEAAGYTDVAVMGDGIQGWVKDGQPVSQPSTATKS